MPLFHLHRRIVVLIALLGVIEMSTVSGESQSNFANLIEEVAPTVVWIAEDVSLFGERIILSDGSGFLTKFSEDGKLVIVTACHVVANAIEHGLIDGVEHDIVAVHPEVTEGFNAGFPVSVEYCSSRYDVAFLQPVRKIGINEDGTDIYERVPLKTYIDQPGRAWFATEEPRLGETVFGMGFPAVGDEFNVTFGRVTSRLKQVYLSGEFTEYFADFDANGQCTVQQRLRDDVVMWATSVDFLGGLPIKWGLDEMRSLLEPGDSIFAVENVGRRVPFDSLLGRVRWAGRVREVTADGEILVDERAYEGLRVDEFLGLCSLDYLGARLSLRGLTGQVVTLDLEREYIGVDAAIRSGSSGGPVFNDRGQLVGMAVFQVSSEEGGNYIARVADILEAYGNFAKE